MEYISLGSRLTRAVDYILFLTADVDVVPNTNEIRDHKYVSKEELQAMFEDSSVYSPACSALVIILRR